MPRIHQYVCDGCGAEKGSTNHWWMVSLDDGTVMAIPLAVYEEAVRIQPNAFPGDTLFFCGEGCAIKKISKAMGDVQAAAIDSQADGVK